MADMDSNPFADPEDNPFGDSGAQSSNKAGTLDDYNPFAQKPAGTAAATLPPPPPAQPAQPAAVAAPTPNINQSSGQEDHPPAYTPSAAQQVDTSELQRRQEELERKAAELQERENKLRERSLQGSKADNWPAFPAGCPVKPCFYQEFELDIPPEFQRVCKIAYYTWIARSVLYGINFFFSIGYFALNDTGSVEAGTGFGLSILWVILWIPCSFLCWYRPVYKALRSDSSINYFWFFIVSAVQILVDLLAVMGPPGTGYLGLLSAVNYMNKDGASTSHKNMGGICFIPMILSLALLGLDLFLLIKVHRYYRGSGASLQKAQGEFTQGVLRNENVRAAGAQMAADAATGAMSNAASGGNTGNRY